MPILTPNAPAAWLPHRDRTFGQMEDQIAQIDRRGWIGDAMIASLPPGVAVLSVGEGFGEMLVRLATRYPDRYFVGTDLSAERVGKAIELVRKRGVANAWLCVADATNLPFAPDAFEAGYIRGVLHILPEPLPALAEMRRVLRTRLLVDRLANRPFFALWFWLLQRYENVRALIQRRPADPAIWQSVVETLATGTYWPLWRYRRWFREDRGATVRASTFLIWERPTHRPIIGWLGTGGAIDVRL
jgi:ubiquinone/menaquinone biosynthesis C-methylase UbiE